MSESCAHRRKAHNRKFTTKTLLYLCSAHPFKKCSHIICLIFIPFTHTQTHTSTKAYIRVKFIVYWHFLFLARKKAASVLSFYSVQCSSICYRQFVVSLCFFCPSFIYCYSSYYVFYSFFSSYFIILFATIARSSFSAIRNYQNRWFVSFDISECVCAAPMFLLFFYFISIRFLSSTFVLPFN